MLEQTVIKTNETSLQRDKKYRIQTQYCAQHWYYPDVHLIIVVILANDVGQYILCGHTGVWQF